MPSENIYSDYIKFSEKASPGCFWSKACENYGQTREPQGPVISLSPQTIAVNWCSI